MKHEPRPTIYMEKQCGWAHNLGETESLGIPRLWQTELARLTESQIWHQPASSVTPWGRRFRKVAIAYLSGWEKSVPQLSS